MKIHLDYSISLSRFSKYFILTDFFLISGWGLVNPIFALFVVGQIEGATAVTVGIAVAIYWLLKSIVQVPIANYLDKTDGERDDFYALFIGLLAIGISAFLFLVVSKPWHLYLVQAIHSLAFALYVPAWSGLFTRHLEKEKSSLGWSFDSTIVGISAGFAGLIGGILVKVVGFKIIFILAGIFVLVAAAMVLAAPRILMPAIKTRSQIIIRDHSAKSQ